MEEQNGRKLKCNGTIDNEKVEQVAFEFVGNNGSLDGVWYKMEEVDGG